MSEMTTCVTRPCGQVRARKGRLFVVVAYETVPTVEIDVEKDIVSRASDAARNDHEEISSGYLGGAGNLASIVDMGLARIEKVKTSLAARALHRSDQRFLIDCAIERHHQPTQMGGNWHHSDLYPVKLLRTLPFVRFRVLPELFLGLKVQP